MDLSAAGWCSACQWTDDTSHCILTCHLYKNNRDILQSTVEIILNREGLNSVCDICLKTLNGAIDNINKQAQNEILSVLINTVFVCNKCSGSCVDSHEPSLFENAKNYKNVKFLLLLCHPSFCNVIV